MFVSQNTSEAIPATITLFENIGTASAPEFRLANADTWEFSKSSFYNLKIQFIDITRDNKPDLVFTATSLQSGSTELYYVAGASQVKIDLEDRRCRRPICDRFPKRLRKRHYKDALQIS